MLRTVELLKELGHQLRQVSGVANFYAAYLTQILSVAVQRGNAASVLVTLCIRLYGICIPMHVHVL